MLANRCAAKAYCRQSKAVQRGKEQEKRKKPEGGRERKRSKEKRGPGTHGGKREEGIGGRYKKGEKSHTQVVGQPKRKELKKDEKNRKRAGR